MTRDVDVLRPDGTDVRLMLQAVGLPGSSAHPLLSTAQLKAIAMSSKWLR